MAQEAFIDVKSKAKVIQKLEQDLNIHQAILY